MSDALDFAPDLSAVLGAAWDEHEADAGQGSQQQADTDAKDEPTQSEGGAARDDKGRFQGGGDAKADAPAAAATQAQPDPPPVAAPDGWKGDWAALPRDVQEAVAARDADLNGRLKERDGGAREWDALNQRLAAHETQLAVSGTSKQQFMSNMIATHEALLRDPAQALPLIARMYGFDIRQLAPQAIQQPQDPILAAIDQRIAPLQQRMQADEQARAAAARQAQVAEAQSLQGQIDAFAKDPANPHFGEVRPMMAALIQGGSAKDLREAYDMACRAHPGVSQKMADEARKADAQRAQREAEAARRRSGSVGGSPVSNSSSSASDSLRGAIEAAFSDA